MYQSVLESGCEVNILVLAQQWERWGGMETGWRGGNDGGGAGGG